MLRRHPGSTLFPYTTLFRSVPGLPARVGEPPRGGRSVRLLAHRCAASADVAAGASCASHCRGDGETADRKSTRLNSSHVVISYAVFCLIKNTRGRHGTVPGQ